MRQTLERSADDSLVILADGKEISQAMIDQVILELGDQEWDICYLDFDKPESKARICRDRNFVIDDKEDVEKLDIGSNPVLISPWGRKKLLSAITKKKRIQDKISTNKIKIYSRGCGSDINLDVHLSYFWFFLAISLTVLLLAMFYSLSPEGNRKKRNKKTNL